MKIEHIGYQVENPAEAAEWYVANLNFRIVRSGGEPAHARFLADSVGTSIIEIYNNPQVQAPDYRTIDPLILHLAVATDQVPEERERLIAAGAVPEGDIVITDDGDELAMLRDPWGFPLQLANRKQPMV